MGPIALFDKSFLESLNPDESVWFDHFFLANVCPMFYVETQADLAKTGSRRGSPDELVRTLANKFPEYAGSPNVHHRTLLVANLLGSEIPDRSQVIRPPGCQATVANQRMALNPESQEARAFLRWTQGDFEDEERRTAAEWRSSAVGSPTSEVIALLTSMGVSLTHACRSLADVRAMSDQVTTSLRPEQQLLLAIKLLGIPSVHVPEITARFENSSRPDLVVLAPYVDFCLRVELFFHLAVDKSRMAVAQRMDICYLFYLPFCHFFVSSDWVHRETAPLFVRDDQEFVWGEELKAALRLLNEQFLSLSESERTKSVFEIAPHPPKFRNNLVTELWERHLPHWRDAKSIKATPDDWRAITSVWNEHIRELEITARARAGHIQHQPSDQLDAVIQRRVTRKRRGSWWFVPENLRHVEPVEDDQVFEFHNGATADTVVNRRLTVYIRDGGAQIASLPGCETFSRDGKLHVDCAPPLNRRYTAPVPKGAVFARSTDGDQLALFVFQSSDLAMLIRKLWEKEERRGWAGES